MVLSLRSPAIPIILFIAIVSFFKIQAFWIEFELVAVENTDSGLVRTNFRVARKEKFFSIQGVVDFVEDLKDFYDCAVKLFYSPKGNNQYVLMPYKIAKGSCCNMMETSYWKTFQRDLEEVSDVPKNTGTERLCFLYKKGKYTVHGITIDPRMIPKVWEAGKYKWTGLIYKTNSKEVDSNFSVVGRL